MKRFLSLIFALMTLAGIVSGCDFMRRLAGRPTSAEIEAKRQLLAAVQTGSSSDSLELAVQAADTLVASVEQQPVEQVIEKDEPESIIPGETVEEMTARYAVSLGAFGKYSEAKALCDRARAAGYDARLIHRRQFVSVAAILTNDRAEAVRVEKEVKKEKFCYSTAIIEK